MSRRTLIVFAGLLALTAARWFAAASLELSPDETYYSLWADNLDWAYYSKGPGVAVAIRAGMELFGRSEFAVRFFAPLLGLGSSIVLFLFARRLYGETAAVFTVALLNLLPLFNAGSLLMTIDPLSIFFWLSALALLYLALERQQGGVWLWAGAGLAMGLGWLSKYTNGLQLLSLVLVFVLFPRYRRHLKSAGPYVLLAVFALCAAPTVWWNARFGWATALHVWDRGGLTRGGGWNPAEILEFTGAHAGVYSPLVFGVFVWAFYKGLREAAVHYRARYIMCFAAPIIVLYFLISIKEAGEANWTAPGFATLGIYAGALWAGRMERRGWKSFTIAAAIIAAILSALAVNTDSVRLALRVAQSGAAHGEGLIWPYRRDPSGRLRGWRTAAEAFQTLRQQAEERLGEPVFLIANKYGTAAALGFYLPDRRIEFPGHPPVYMPETQTIENQFAFWGRYDEFTIPEGGRPIERGPDAFNEVAGVNRFIGRSALYVTDDVKPDLQSPKKPGVGRAFEEMEWLADFEVLRHGQPVRRFRVFECRRYKSTDL